MKNAILVLLAASLMMVVGMTKSEKKVISVSSILLTSIIFLFGFASLTNAETTYTYLGNSFNRFHGDYACSPQCSITGSFTIAGPPLINLSGIPSQNQFNVTPITYSFTDGNVTATNANSCSDFFTISTDGSGNITSWVIRIFTPSLNSPCAGGGSYTGVQLLSENDKTGIIDITSEAPEGINFAAIPQGPGNWSTATGVPAAKQAPFGHTRLELAGPEAMSSSLLPPAIEAPESEIPQGERERPIGYPIPLEKLKAIKQSRRRLLQQPSSSQPGQNPDQQALEPPRTLIATRSFEGLRFTGDIPPDPTIAAGPLNFVLAVNSTWAAYNKAGTKQFQTTFSTWFSNVGTLNVEMTDPWVIYDFGSGRFFLLVDGINSSTKESYLYISTSQQSDAAGSWCNYRINAKHIGGTVVTDTWADYPKIGADIHGLYITANMFTFAGDFQYSKLYVLNKGNFLSCGKPTGTVFYDLRNNDGTKAFTVQPALTQDSPGVEYLINAHVPFTSYPGGNGLTLWSVTNPTASPILKRTKLPVLPYEVSPNAEQPDTDALIDTSDGRLLNASFRQGHLWTTHTVLSASFNNVSAVRIYRIAPETNSTILDAQYTAAGIHYFNGSVMPEISGRATAVFNRSSTSEFAGIRYAQRLSGVWKPSVVLKNGETTNTTGRWGDFAGSSLDPDGTTIWLYNQYTKRGVPWGTWVGEIK